MEKEKEQDWFDKILTYKTVPWSLVDRLFFGICCFCLGCYYIVLIAS